MSAAVLAIILLAALLAPLLAPYDPSAQPDIVGLAQRPPSGAHPFGTDPLSRDVLSRVVHGGRVSISVALLAALLSASIGTAYGAIAAFAGGVTDAIMMRVLDALIAIPRLLLLLLVVTLWGAVSVPTLIVIIAATGWFTTSRLVRARVLALSRDDFVVAADALGVPRRRVLWRHVMPNALSPVIVAATLGVANVIALEATLSYLGLGVRPPSASWGTILQDGGDCMAACWWVTAFPGIAIIAAATAFNALGDSVRDAFDPRGERVVA